MRIGRGQLVRASFGALLLAATACAAPISTAAGNAPSTAAISIGGSIESVAGNAAVSPALQPFGGSAPATTTTPSTSAAGVIATPLPQCRPASLRTLRPDSLTFATGRSTSAPWFAGDNPMNGRGYESAVAFAVARELGFRTTAVRWVRVDTTAVTSGMSRGFDAAIGEFPTPDQPSSVVDYSTGYFGISDSVVARPGTAAARVTGVAGLKAFRVAAISGTSETRSLAAQVAPARSAQAVGSAAAALSALKAGTVDVAVVPTPVAIDAGSTVSVVGQLSLPTEQPPQFGMILPKASPLTSCVSAAIDELRVTGALTTLLRTWVPEADKPLR